ncbi:MAG: hypothetical protein HWQ42_03890 [Nostoc sp. JL23]|nr:hypothetical protein [Nostoc sp. JL23]
MATEDGTLGWNYRSRVAAELVCLYYLCEYRLWRLGVGSSWLQGQFSQYFGQKRSLLGLLVD